MKSAIRQSTSLLLPIIYGAGCVSIPAGGITHAALLLAGFALGIWWFDILKWATEE